ncbi:MAG: SocA family protein [Magnetococcales bacterium]|nr:SocA family protein [Magnetococcales bacterium]
MGFHAILKLLFFADKYHLNRFGRPIVGDRYVAMPYGPVASVTYDILKGNVLAMEMAGEDPLPFEVRHHANRPHVHSNRPARLEMLSDSDIEALEYSFAMYGHLGFDELYRISHEDPAYRNAEERGLNTTIRYEDLIEDSGDRDELIQDLRETAPDLVF